MARVAPQLIQAVVAPSTPPLPSPPPPGPPMGHPRTEQARLLGVFAVSLATSDFSLASYLAVVLDKGSLFLPHSPAALGQVGRLVLGATFGLALYRRDPARMSFDRVELDLGFKRFQVAAPPPI